VSAWEVRAGEAGRVNKSARRFSAARSSRRAAAPSRPARDCHPAQGRGIWPLEAPQKPPGLPAEYRQNGRHTGTRRWNGCPGYPVAGAPKQL